MKTFQPCIHLSSHQSEQKQLNIVQMEVTKLPLFQWQAGELITPADLISALSQGGTLAMRPSPLERQRAKQQEQKSV